MQHNNAELSNNSLNRSIIPNDDDDDVPCHCAALHSMSLQCIASYCIVVSIAFWPPVECCN